MKNFLKIVLATLVGQVILLLIIFLIGLSAISGLQKKEVKTIQPSSVLLLEFNSVISDQSPSEEVAFFSQFSLGMSAPVGLMDMVNKIDKASKDEKIKGILLDLTLFGAGYGKAEEIHAALINFKKSGKFVYAYSDFFYNNTYYLASAADKIYLNPQGEILFNGLVSDILFFKGALEKLGIEIQVVKRGKFKGAVEPYIREDLSEENRAQIKSYINSVFDEMVKDIAAGRKLDQTKIRSIADGMLVRNPEEAKSMGLVDDLFYRDQLFDQIRSAMKLKKEEKISFVKLSDIKLDTKTEESKIAVVYASGDIVNGQGQVNEVGADRFAKILRDIRKNDDIKAVVLRVDSRGGSALASEIIWREAILLKKVKPLIVSMSDVAASGGYYISCMADTIVAYPQTITGSIGVFGLFPNAEKLMHDKLGITSEYVGTGAYSDFGRIDRKLTNDELGVIDGMVGRVYETFLKRVSAGRSISVEMVDSFGQGRVWTGTMAKERGLVDVLGGMDKAIAIASHKAGLKNYEIEEFPKSKSFFDEVMGKLNKEETARAMLRKELGSTYDTYLKIRKISEYSGVQALMPYEIQFK
jgi:protease-4